MGLPTVSGFGFSHMDPFGAALERNWAKRDAEDANVFTQQSAQRQMDFQERMSNTAWQRGTKDMLAAGINPMLAISQGGAHPPSGGSSFAGQQPRGVNIPGGSVNMMSAAQLAMIEAQTDRTHAEAEEIRRRTPTHEVSIDKMRQDIAESIERMEKIRQDVKTGAATAAQLQQHVINMKEMLPQIRAQTNQLGTLAKLNEAQAIAQLEGAGLSREQANATRQRIIQDLPALERQLGLLEKTAMEMAQPGHMATEAAQSSFAGQLGAYLRAIIPLGGVMGAIPLGRFGRGAPATESGRSGWAGHGSQHRGR